MTRRKQWVCACEGCGCTDKPIHFNGMFSMALCPVCMPNPPQEALERRLKEIMEPDVLAVLDRIVR